MRKKLVLFLALVLVCSIVFTACGNKLAGDNKGTDNTGDTGSPAGQTTPERQTRRKQNCSWSMSDRILTPSTRPELRCRRNTDHPRVRRPYDPRQMSAVRRRLRTILSAKTERHTPSICATTSSGATDSRLPRMTTFTHGTVRSIRTQRPTMSTCSMLSKVMTRKH